jgi:hypothetical protein
MKPKRCAIPTATNVRPGRTTKRKRSCSESFFCIQKMGRKREMIGLVLNIFFSTLKKRRERDGKLLSSRE